MTDLVKCCKVSQWNKVGKPNGLTLVLWDISQSDILTSLNIFSSYSFSIHSLLCAMWFKKKTTIEQNKNWTFKLSLKHHEKEINNSNLYFTSTHQKKTPKIVGNLQTLFKLIQKTEGISSNSSETQGRPDDARSRVRITGPSSEPVVYPAQQHEMQTCRTAFLVQLQQVHSSFPVFYILLVLVKLLNAQCWNGGASYTWLIWSF